MFTAWVLTACGSAQAPDPFANLGGSPSGGTGAVPDPGGDSATGGDGGTSVAPGQDTTGGAAMIADTPTLKDVAAASKRLVGAALSAGYLSDARYKQVAAQQFSYVTPENEMKWAATEPTRGQFSFTAGDAIVDFAAQNGMKVRGHTLVWYQALPAWVKELQGDDLRQAMVDHVTAVATHYRGKVHAWDVVNEAIADGPTGALRSENPFTALGVDYIDEAFRAARAADPEALLFYNDYEGDAAGTPKSDAIYQLVKDMVDRGVPIDGVGMQFHLDPRRLPLLPKVRENMQRIADLGLLVDITEMDVPVGIVRGDEAMKFARQAEIYRDYVSLCSAFTACDAVTFWGFTDKYSWLNFPQWAMLRGPGPHKPLLFDAEYAPKPAFDAVRNALKAP